MWLHQLPADPNATAMGPPHVFTLNEAGLKDNWIAPKGSRMLYKYVQELNLGNLARDQCNQPLKGEWPTHPPTKPEIWCCHIKAFSLWDGAYLYYQSIGWRYTIWLYSLLPMNILSNSQTYLTSGSKDMVKEPSSLYLY